MNMEHNGMLYPAAHLANGLIFRELAYEDSNLLKLIEIVPVMGPLLSLYA